MERRGEEKQSRLEAVINPDCLLQPIRARLIPEEAEGLERDDGGMDGGLAG